MAVRGLLALVDDIATLTKIAAKKTMGLSGDDLAVNAHALAGEAGIDPKRELPMVYKVAKGSMVNKFKYLIPAAMGLSVVAPWAIPPLMMFGGAFLVYEGMEKMLHKEKPEAEGSVKKDAKTLEDEKVAGAIKTDFVLSAEIIVVSLGAVAAAPFLTQLGVLAAVGVAMTAGIYGLVGGLVKLDDIGLHLAKEGDGWFAKAQRSVGKALVNGVPPMMKGLSFLGTAAMFAVGGGILLHGIPMLGHAVLTAGTMLSSSPFIAAAVETAASIGLGMLTGLAAIPVVKVLKEPVGHVLGLAKTAFDDKIGKPLKDYAKKVWGRVWGKSPAEPVNDNVVSVSGNVVREPVAAPGALQDAPSIKAAHDAAAAKPAEPILPEEVKPPAPEFSAFEKNLTRNFGK